MGDEFGRDLLGDKDACVRRKDGLSVVGRYLIELTVTPRAKGSTRSGRLAWRGSFGGSTSLDDHRMAAFTISAML